MRNKIFPFLLLCVGGILIFTMLYPTTSIPNLEDFLQAFAIPISYVGVQFDDVLTSLRTITDFFNGGSLPTIEDIYMMLVTPFKLAAEYVGCFFQILGNLVELFGLIEK